MDATNPVCAELADFIASGPSQKAVAEFQASKAASERVADLIHRQKTNVLSREEKDELALCLHIEHLMRMTKALARQRLASAGT